MGARHRRARRPAPKIRFRRRFRRWLRRPAFSKRVRVVAVVALTVLAAVLIVPRLCEERRDSTNLHGTPAGEKTSPAPTRREPVVRSPAAHPQQQARTARFSPPPKAPPAAQRTSRTVAASIIGPQAAIVIDDLGQSLSHLEQLAGLNLPLSIAVIPGLPASARTVSEASRRGIEMLLHQPMEPREGAGNPGEGVLLTSMTREALRARVHTNLDAVPGAVGVNNHMGSRFTEDAAGLDAVMAEIREHGLFWLDSRTTAETRGIEVARAAGVPVLERDIFLDAEVNVDFIRAQVRKLIETARVRGTAVGIGHPHPETIAVLRELRGELLASGVTLVPVSTLVRSNSEIGPGTALAAAPAGKGEAGKPATNRKTATP